MSELEALKRIRDDGLWVESVYSNLLNTFSRIHDQLVKLSKEAAESCNILLVILIEVDRRIVEAKKVKEDETIERGD